MSTVHVPPSSPDLGPGRRTAEVVGDATDACEKYRGVESSHSSSARDTRGGRYVHARLYSQERGLLRMSQTAPPANPGSSGERRDDLGGGSSVTSLDREIWGASGVLYRLEERVQTQSDSGGTDAGQKFRLRSLDAWGRSWAFGPSPPGRPRPRARWSGTNGPVRIG